MEFLSNWVKDISVAVIIVSILEMLLPNNKIKKYIKIVMGTFVLFSIISPFVQKNFNVDEINLEDYIETSVSQVDTTSMDNRIGELYIEELEKDITKKVEQKGFIVNSCKVEAKIADNVNDTKIDKIILNVEKNEEKEEEKNFEEKLVSEIQNIKKVNISEKAEDKKLKKSQENELRSFLVKEYEVKDKCLVIN